MRTKFSLVSLVCLVGCAGTVQVTEPTEPQQQELELRAALEEDDVEAICRAAGASRCQRLDTEQEERSVEVYDDENEHQYVAR